MIAVTSRILARAFLVVALVAPTAPAGAQQWRNVDPDAESNTSAFRALDLPTPNEYRNASGMPGREYWQQRVDYEIRTALDTVEHAVSGSERITYHNNSPDTLHFLWFQLDQNVVSLEHSRTYASTPALPPTLSPQAREFLARERFDGGHRIGRVAVENAAGRMVSAEHLITGTQMRVNLAAPLAPGARTHVEIDWSFRVPDDGRGAKEQVSDGWLYLVAQWFPRLAVYDDINGWQNDQFLGRGEFYLEFGSYDVRITVPRNHIVQATGVLQNPEEVLTATQRQRLERAFRDTVPVFIVAPNEVMTAATRPSGRGDLTWHFRADSVRDFAWASSKTFVWDAAGFRYRAGGPLIEAHSLYPRDAMPLWDKVSTRAIIQTMETYGRMSIEYPYPKAVNVHGPIYGMEYPMVAFCEVRPAPDGTYTEAQEHALISVTIHEVGHNWFPMIVASDERKFTWMDEGLNTFLQYYAEKDWSPEYPSFRGPARNIVDYMRDPDQTPIMTHSDQIHRRFGDHSYGKPAAGLVLLREQVLGPERFDLAFRDYSRAWAFRHPQPADFFRSIESGSGENLAWFWRGWFYTTHANDQVLADVSTQDAMELIGTTERGRFYHRIRIDNAGGLVMPVQIQVTYGDGSGERVRLPVEIWRFNENSFTYGFFSDRPLADVVLDPDEVLADVDTSNNRWTRPVS